MRHRFFRRLSGGLSGLLAAFAPTLAGAATMATERVPLAGHAYFMVALSVLFVVVFAITISSLARHRKSIGDQPSKFAGPTGSVQWLWAMVPFAILLFVDYILLSIHFAG